MTRVAPAPEGFLALLNATPDRRASGVELDLPANVARAEAFLRDRAPAVEGQGGDEHTYKTAAWVRDLGVSEPVALELMQLGWNERCTPPWEPEDLAVKVANAFSYSQNEAGSWAVAPLDETFKHMLDQGGAVERGRYWAYSEHEQDHFEEPSWLVKDLVPDHGLVMLYGPGGSYKSFIALDVALTLASGIPGWDRMESEPACVVFVAGEGPRSIARYRRPAWRAAHGIEGPIDFHITMNMMEALREETVAQFITTIQGQGLKPRLVVIDTLARFMWGLDENSAKDCGIAYRALETIRDALRCAVLVVHHSGLEGGRSRGSTSLVAAFDTQHEVKANKEALTVAVHNRRARDSEERGQPWCFEGKHVGKSLVFNPISRGEHWRITHSTDMLTREAVAKALAKLGTAVTTEVLATELSPHVPDETPEERADAVARTRSALDQGAKKDPLAGYVTSGSSARDRMWGLP